MIFTAMPSSSTAILDIAAKGSTTFNLRCCADCQCHLQFAYDPPQPRPSIMAPTS